MSKKKKVDKAKVNEKLGGFEVAVNSFGEINKSRRRRIAATRKAPADRCHNIG